ncbi:MAG: endonuclease III [Candidatus Bathyarchaeia archaeon]|jgi:endonuclease-3
MSRTKRAEEALRRVQEIYPRTWTQSNSDQFKSLIRTILSQNTNWRNENTAYRRLEESIGVTPKKLSNASISKIADAIKPAGMYNQRSRTIKKVSEEVIERYNGDLSSIIAKTYYEARKELMTLPGVGEKTADVVLLFTAGKQVLPVDRHITRITNRLELVKNNSKYDTIRMTLERATTPEKYLDIHIKLIQFGRDICRALNPKCSECPLNDICPYPQRAEKTIK